MIHKELYSEGFVIGAVPSYVALLRAVNLGGSTQVRMGDLRDRLSESGFDKVRTLLNSGNIVFQFGVERREEIERRIEDVVAGSFGRPTECFVRTGKGWQNVIARNPFLTEAAEDPGRMTVLVLKAAPPAAAWKALQASITGREIVRGDSDHGYVVYPDGQGHSRLTPDRIERALGTRGTIRNWNTVSKIGSLLAE
jgi:uncharacterized protein (DUF1697 family)